MKLEIYNQFGKLLSEKDCGDFYINLSQLPVIKKEQNGNVLKVWVSN